MKNFLFARRKQMKTEEEKKLNEDEVDRNDFFIFDKNKKKEMNVKISNSTGLLIKSMQHPHRQHQIDMHTHARKTIFILNFLRFCFGH